MESAIQLKTDFRRRSYQDLAVGNAIPIFWQQQQIDHKSQQELMGLDVIIKLDRNGILFPKIFWPTVRKNCSCDWEFFLRSL